jgi:tetratricopeptide (TPR) repeat protein
MKRFAILILTVLILSACTSNAYTDSINAGKQALQKGNYTDAVHNFENALEEKETDEAKEYLHLSESLQESLKLYQDGEFEAALHTIEKVITKKSEKLDGKILKNANELREQIVKTIALSDSLKDNIVKAKTLLDQKQFDDAYEVFLQVSETDLFTENESIEKLTKEAAELLLQTTMLKNANETEQEKQKIEEENKQKVEEEKNTQEETSKPLTHEQAEELVRKHLNLQSDPTIHVKYDHDAQNGDYIVQVYEVVVDDPKTGQGHTATWGWYGVNKTTKTVYDAMN